QATLNRLRATASGLADDYGMLEANQNVVTAIEQSRDVLIQAGIAATTAGFGAGLTAMRGSANVAIQVAGRVGQLGMGTAFTIQGGATVYQGAKDIYHAENFSDVA